MAGGDGQEVIRGESQLSRIKTFSCPGPKKIMGKLIGSGSDLFKEL